MRGRADRRFDRLHALRTSGTSMPEIERQNAVRIQFVRSHQRAFDLDLIRVRRAAAGCRGYGRSAGRCPVPSRSACGRPPTRSARSPPSSGSASGTRLLPSSISIVSTPSSCITLSGPFGGAPSVGLRLRFRQLSRPQSVLFSLSLQDQAPTPAAHRATAAVGVWESPAAASGTAAGRSRSSTAWAGEKLRDELLRPSAVRRRARVTIRPVAVEISSAGIWLTSPSPIVSSVYVAAPS